MFLNFSAYPVRVYPELSPECHSRHSQWHCHLGGGVGGRDWNLTLPPHLDSFTLPNESFSRPHMLMLYGASARFED